MQSESNENPYAVSPEMASLADPARRQPWLGRGSRWDVFFMLMVFLACVVGSAFAWFEIESILVSGPTLSAISLAMFVRVLLSIRWRGTWLPGLAFSLAGPFFSLSIWAAIYLKHWSPNDATGNGVPEMCILFTVLVAALGWFAWSRLPAETEVEAT